MDSFTVTDCWILFSIGFTQTGSSLKDIIVNGDRINHAIIELGELKTGLNKLLCNGFIYEKSKVYFVTEKAISFYNEHKKAKEGYIEEWNRISDIFVKLQTSEFHISYELSEEVYKAALDEYMKPFNLLTGTIGLFNNKKK